MVPIVCDDAAKMQGRPMLLFFAEAADAADADIFFWPVNTIVFRMLESSNCSLKNQISEQAGARPGAAGSVEASIQTTCALLASQAPSPHHLDVVPVPTT